MGSIWFLKSTFWDIRAGTRKLPKLLSVYPEFDENSSCQNARGVRMAEWGWTLLQELLPPAPQGALKWYSNLVDEIVEVFDATDFHAGMDEVFYLADEKMPTMQWERSRHSCFAREVTKISDHLEQRDVRLWIWGDRFDWRKNYGHRNVGGQHEQYGQGHWYDSEIGGHQLDWHYERADPTPAYFAQKGFDVIACPWRKPEVTVKQVKMMRFS